MNSNRAKRYWLKLAASIFLIVTPLFHSLTVLAVSVNNGPVNVTAIVPGPPPTTPATVLHPTTNTLVSVTPMVASGTCGAGLEVRLYNNGNLAGSTMCATDGTFTINFTLIPGINDLTTLNFDPYEQSGPASPTVTVYVVLPGDEGEIPIPNVPRDASGRPISGTRPGGNQPTNAETPVDPETNLPLNPTTSHENWLPAFANIVWLLFILFTLLIVLLADFFLNKRRIIHTLVFWRTNKK